MLNHWCPLVNSVSNAKHLVVYCLQRKSLLPVCIPVITNYSNLVINFSNGILSYIKLIWFFFVKKRQFVY